MADLDRLTRALKAADAAGDAEAATRFAAEIRRIRGSGARESFDPTEGMSGVDKFLAGTGKAVVDLGRGIKQLGVEAGNRLGIVPDETVQGIQSDIDAAADRDRALMQSGPAIAGNLAGNLATMVVPGGAGARGAQALNLGRTASALRGLSNPASLRAATGSGAAFGAVSPTETGESRLMNAAGGAVAGAAGQGVARGVGALAQPFRGSGGRAVERLQAAGVPLDLAQRTGSPALQRIKSGLSANPITAGAQRGMGESQQKAFTKAVLQTIGEDTEAATQDVMGAAKSRIGRVFNDVAENNPIAYDNALQQGLSDLMTEASRELNESQMRVLGRQVDEVLNKAASSNGAVPGKAFQNIKESLDRLSQGSDSSLGFWARELREQLHDALERSAKPEDLARLREARQQWGNMRTIEGAISKDGDGIVSPLRLSNALGTKKNRWRSVYGGGDQTLVELAQAGRNVLPETLPDSGTAGRLLAAGMMSGGFGGGAYALTGDPQTALLAAGMGVGGPKAAQALLNRVPDRRRYLAEGLKRGPLRSLLEAPERHSAIGAPTRQALLAAYLTGESVQ